MLLNSARWQPIGVAMSAVRATERRVPVRVARLRTLFAAVIAVAALAELFDVAAHVWRWLAVAAICLTGIALAERPPRRPDARHPAVRAARRQPDHSLVVDALDLPVGVVGPDGVLRSTNPAWVACARRHAIALAQGGRNQPVGVFFQAAFGADPVQVARATGGTLTVATGFEASFEFDVRFAHSADEHWHRLRASPLAGGGAVVCLQDVTAQRRSDQLTHQVLHDALTGLPNRTLFGDRLVHALRRAQRSRQRVGVLYLDLDGFKKVNDTLGHAAGDRLLVEISARLSRTLRPGDTLARLSGDEFAVVCDPVDDERSALAIAQRLIDAVSEPVVIDRHQAQVGASVGVAVHVPGQPVSQDALLRRADAAMYRAKRAGRGCVRLAHPEPVPEPRVVDLRERREGRVPLD